MTHKNEPENPINKVSTPFRPTDTWTDKSFNFGGFSNQHTEFFIIFNFKDQLNTTLSQEDQQAQAQTYTPSRKIKTSTFKIRRISRKLSGDRQ